MRKYIDIINESQQPTQEEIEEGWKSALGAAAMGAAAVTGIGMAPANSSPATQHTTQALPTFSDKAEAVAKEQGFDSAEAMYYFMKQREQGSKVTVDAFDRALQSAKDASIIHPANLLQYVSDKVKAATDDA